MFFFFNLGPLLPKFHSLPASAFIRNFPAADRIALRLPQASWKYLYNHGVLDVAFITTASLKHHHFRKTQSFVRCYLPDKKLIEKLWLLFLLASLPLSVQLWKDPKGSQQRRETMDWNYGVPHVRNLEVEKGMPRWNHKIQTW